MLRDVSMEEISDGKLYGSNDMVKADCGDCKGCSACCHGMGTSIVLDPLDVHRLSGATGQSFQMLLQGPVELNVADGLILPNLKMTGDEEGCFFLDKNERCSIHAARPGICRLFPLGRYYEGDGYQYFLQIHECRNQNRTKVKVRKWIDTPDFSKYEKFVADWHLFLKEMQDVCRKEGVLDMTRAKTVSMLVLNFFFITPFLSERDFYDQFSERLSATREKCLGLE